jgi:hypothetical protein
MMERQHQLFLDDRRPAPVGWHLVRSFDAFKEYIEERGVPQVISFDHDLGIEDENNGTKARHEYREKTGYDCAKLLIDKNEFPKLAIVHSFNPAGARDIAELLSPHCVVTIQPWSRNHYVGYF